MMQAVSEKQGKKHTLEIRHMHMMFVNCHRKIYRVVVLNFFSITTYGNLDCNVSPEIGAR